MPALEPRFTFRGADVVEVLERVGRSLPSADRLLDAITSFQTALAWPETQQRIQALLKGGLQKDSDLEKRWPEVLGSLLERAERTKG